MRFYVFIFFGFSQFISLFKKIEILLYYHVPECINNMKIVTYFKVSSKILAYKFPIVNI